MTRKIKWLAELAGLVMLGTGCGGGVASVHAPTPVTQQHVFLIVMENRSPAEALTGPFTASLAASYGLADGYRAVAHPSVPNYLALSSGSTWGVTDDSYHVLPQADLGDELTAAGVSWKAYMEGMGDGGCFNSPLPYDPGHNPFAFYGGRCPANVVPFASFASDLAAGPPRFSWISPDRCHDEHDCAVSAGDSWLREQAGAIMSSAAWRAGGVLFITWDEDDGSAGNRVLTLVISPTAGHRVSERAYDHYSLLATVEDLLGVRRLGNSATAVAMTDLLKSQA
ncbi:MAG TPA: alkaline phosphatase family protein [Patescibacteria group bacterium]|nr:alkaline phosphatase family protein [Patescibacteria group bacterium]